MQTLAQRRALLTAAPLRWREPVPLGVIALARWMNSWPGLGAVVLGMTAQGFNVELREFPSGWRANFYDIGTAHSVVLRSAYASTSWTAVQCAAWKALKARS